VRLITVDRPGIGKSDPKPERSLTGWAADVEELAEQLNIDRFSVSGWSAGAAYALACASELQNRVGTVTLICGIGRLDLPGFVAQMSTGWAYRLAAGAPWAMSLFYSSTGRLARRSPTAAKAILSPGFPKVDRAVINRPGVAARLMPAYADATRNSRGPVDDMRLVLRPWDFDPSGIRQPVHLFHGRMDVVTPPAHAEHWMGILDHIHPTWVEDAGHFLIEDQIGAIVRTLSA
jgi:pimeloyl-ACP methyl ester carboxylesterase